MLLLASNVAAFLYSLSVGFEHVLLENSFRPAYLFESVRLETVLTSLFLHASIAHLVGNMLFLYVFGRTVEDAFGALPFFALYTASGFAGTLLHVAMLLLLPPSALSAELERPLVGASGAVSGIVGAYVALYPHARIATLIPFYYILVIRVPVRYYVFFWYLYQLTLGVVSLRQPLTIAAWAHIGGFAAGAAVAILYRRVTSRTLPPSSRY